MIPLNDLARSVTSSDGDDLGALVAKVVKSGSYILGEQVHLFEREFADFIGAGFVSAVASGTDALVIALRSLGVTRGSKVILTPNAGGYSTNALLEIGARPLFVDVDHMGRVDLEQLAVALDDDPEIKCVIVTHLYGLNSHVEEVAALCQRHAVKLLEDCAQAAGARAGEKFLGSFGHAATFSFYPTKNLGSLGDAGAIATNSPLLALEHVRLRQYGWSSRYEVATSFGRNSRMDEIQAAVLRDRLGDLDFRNKRRRDIWRIYFEALAGSQVEIIGLDSDCFVAHLAILVVPTATRKMAQEFLESREVGTSVHYPILDYQQPAWAGFLSGYCPLAESLRDRILTIPLFPELTDPEVEYVARALTDLGRKVYKSV